MIPLVPCDVGCLPRRSSAEILDTTVRSDPNVFMDSCPCARDDRSILGDGPSDRRGDDRAEPPYGPATGHRCPEGQAAVTVGLLQINMLVQETKGERDGTGRGTKDHIRHHHNVAHITSDIPVLHHIACIPPRPLKISTRRLELWSDQIPQFPVAKARPQTRDRKVVSLSSTNQPLNPIRPTIISPNQHPTLTLNRFTLTSPLQHHTRTSAGHARAVTTVLVACVEVPCRSSPRPSDLPPLQGRQTESNGRGR